MLSLALLDHPKCRENDLLFLLLQQKPLWIRIDSSTIGRHTVEDGVFFPPPSIQFSTGSLSHYIMRSEFSRLSPLLPSPPTQTPPQRLIYTHTEKFGVPHVTLSHSPWDLYTQDCSIPGGTTMPSHTQPTRLLPFTLPLSSSHHPH